MRPDILNPLFTESTALKGVGAALARPLERLGLLRAVDLAFHLPVAWIERQKVRRLAEAETGRMVGLVLMATDYRASGSPRAPFRIHAQDEAGDPISIVYFGKNSGWPRKLFPLGEMRFVSGRLDRFGDDLQIVHPDHVVELGEAAAIPEREPVYGLSEGITNGRMRELVAQGVARAPELAEWIEPGLLARKDWPGWHMALGMVHQDPGARLARERLAYDEVFAGQLALMVMRASSRRRRGIPITGDGHLRDVLKLPFAPTGAQRRVFGEIEGDMAQSIPMLRLLQGDVGSGKTLVALMALLNAVEAGGQGAFLAPTEILARQHFASLQAMLAGLPVNVALLTGRDKGKARQSTLMGLADGSMHILVGTHAIFQEAVSYRNLVLAVIDEQHRFGVSQRLLLTAKAERTPHLLVMTATPIPRTLTLAQYGDMDVSRLDEMPPGRQPVDTRVISDARMEEVIEGLGRHIDAGRQAYWVCPLVEQGEAEDEAAAEARAAILRNRFGADRVGVVHGRMPGAEKDAVMEAFASGRLRLLVATTVIEVGVDVPNATLMIVEAAERFGLAQLHQLRGRVGRGDQRSFCMLLHGQNLSETARARLALMRETNDGFRIAEEDLRLRGAGELLGTRQSGEQRFRLASPEQIQELISAAHDDARLLMDRDGGLDSPRGQAARLCLYLFERDAAISLLSSG
ncbi:ATP-dependent DNA helicase RecG [Sphingobium nicotianae]|uniref:ATP-dependent DNA helicase RecG n=1 Tax=Sphingobium nicotianae TaxID=2782607 RepID=A0A9X1DD50_9SPHN|nr:ATP-dependent DNA helicase RecG [Sphingobium nicotianae]MBT2187700.1 ATP-dependent DNA helicase RecG [Sphingobium nicotianae]